MDVYACEGRKPDGSPYTAVVEIVKRQETYLVRWTQENDDQVMGVGIQQAGVLAVSYFGGAPAIVVYSVAGEGRLDGSVDNGRRGPTVQGNADQSRRRRGSTEGAEAVQTHETDTASDHAAPIPSRSDYAFRPRLLSCRRESHQPRAPLFRARL